MSRSPKFPLRTPLGDSPVSSLEEPLGTPLRRAPSPPRSAIWQPGRMARRSRLLTPTSAAAGSVAKRKKATRTKHPGVAENQPLATASRFTLGSRLDSFSCSPECIPRASQRWRADLNRIKVRPGSRSGGERMPREDPGLAAVGFWGEACRPQFRRLEPNAQPSVDLTEQPRLDALWCP